MDVGRLLRDTRHGVQGQGRVEPSGIDTQYHRGRSRHLCPVHWSIAFYFFRLLPEYGKVWYSHWRDHSGHLGSNAYLLLLPAMGRNDQFQRRSPRG